eukprot:TRINITY_DN18091_c0_g1_i2.p1 TRINITY_DN18091_c0_g1~~TRINITY_DN18091_c0_g1_i2.p1  ORF type:complete len:327 (-),score=59.52 TRINITY_DN18091_c0_g1_i2:185-1165(-)
MSACSVAVSGIAGHICDLRLEKQVSVAEVKAAIASAAGIHVREQRLYLLSATSVSPESSGSRELSDNTTELKFFLCDAVSRVKLMLVRRPPRQAEWLENVSANWRSLCAAPEDIRLDREVVLASVLQHGHALEFAAEALQAGMEIVSAAVRCRGLSLRFASSSLRACREVVLAAVRQHGGALQFANESLRSDREIALAAVSTQGYALQFVGASLRDERQLVLLAVSSDGAALSSAGAKLRADEEIVTAAVREDGFGNHNVSPCVLHLGRYRLTAKLSEQRFGRTVSRWYTQRKSCAGIAASFWTRCGKTVVPCAMRRPNSKETWRW